jgi:ATP-dependent Clp protease ATP-binding subunit ClpA
LISLEARIHEQFVDQDEAVHAVADALREHRMLEGAQGVASFFFVGPSGTGKTELGKVLARVLWGQDRKPAIVDMTRYAEETALGNLASSIAEQVRSRPYGVLIFDEFEKAHPKAWNLLLRIMDEGAIESNGTVSLKDTICIASSNAHGDIVQEGLRGGKSIAAIADYLRVRLADVFPQELLSRFSRIIVFKELGMKECETIASFELGRLKEKLETSRKVLSWTPSVPQFLAAKSYDALRGARGIREAVERNVAAPLAAELLKNEGIETVELAVEGNQVTIRTA